MKLIIGGFAQGKTEYAKESFPGARMYNEDTFDELCKLKPGEAADNRIILNHLHLCIRQMLTENRDREYIEGVINKIIEKCPELLIICDEIGNGVVPMDAFERDYREITGRILIEIAKKSKSVERIICQIPNRLK